MPIDSRQRLSATELVFDTGGMGRFSEVAVELDEFQSGQIDRVVLLDEPSPASAATWQYAGKIDVWIRDKGEWYGRVRDDAGGVEWVPAGDLRKEP